MDELIYNILLDLPIVMLLVIIGLSLYILGKGADLLVNEAIGLSIRWGIPKMIVGATIVSLGTTIPEVTVSVLAAMNGSPDLALGNAIGSIITNTALILGVAALIGKLEINKKVLGKQGIIQLILAFLLLIVSLPNSFIDASGSISTRAGWLFLILLILYIVDIIISSKNIVEEGSQDSNHQKNPLILQIFKLILGIIIVIVSSNILIPSVEITAIQIGIPESIIAATLVAFGTSLPEFITSITAVKKGHGDLAIGNITGANILNILFVIGSSAVVTKDGLLVSPIFYKLQIPTMIIILSIFYIISKNKKSIITKLHGGIFLGIYVVYLLLNYIWA